MDVKPGETARGVMMGLAWMLNIAVAEWIIRRPMRHSQNVLAVA
jgi:hypothetical protein